MYYSPIGLTIAETAEHFECEDRLLDAIDQLPLRGPWLDHIFESKVGVAKRDAFGTFMFRPKQILLTELPRESFERARGTFLHECAHLLDYARRGTSDHGPLWRSWAHFLGCPARATEPDPVWREAFDATLRSIAVCTRCGHQWKRQRRRDFSDRIHSNCGGRLVNVFESREEAARFGHYGPWVLLDTLAG